ncbi:YggT family protein [Prochlorococcus sp. MIT 0602]|nr:YggT family protein [Prochlorococcus sp. MIT 0602]KGG18146.1 YggT family protein [Prochlorococcus sp. MIT 0603]
MTGLLLAAWTLAFLMRIVLTWYPQVKIHKGFWLIFFIPTEIFLANTRRFIAPIGGVDITPVIWFGIISLSRELLVGPQGIISQILLNQVN